MNWRAYTGSKDEFVTKLESLQPDDCCTQGAMAQAMGMSVTTFKKRADEFGVNWRAYTTSNKK